MLVLLCHTYYISEFHFMVPLALQDVATAAFCTVTLSVSKKGLCAAPLKELYTSPLEELHTAPVIGIILYLKMIIIENKLIDHIASRINECLNIRVPGARYKQRLTR